MEDLLQLEGCKEGLVWLRTVVLVLPCLVSDADKAQIFLSQVQIYLIVIPVSPIDEIYDFMHCIGVCI